MPLDDEKRKDNGKTKRDDILGQYARRAAPGKQVKAEHEVKEGDTLSAIALKYYGSAEREKWMAIYEFNKAAIGDDPNLIEPGLVLKIPEL